MKVDITGFPVPTESRKECTTREGWWRSICRIRDHVGSVAMEDRSNCRLLDRVGFIASEPQALDALIYRLRGGHGH